MTWCHDIGLDTALHGGTTRAERYEMALLTTNWGSSIILSKDIRQRGAMVHGTNSDDTIHITRCTNSAWITAARLNISQTKSKLL